MQVFVELALLENFCMDFTLMYCSKLVAKNPASIWRIVLCSAVGACFAVVFPLFGVSGVWAVVIKIISGFIICLLGGKFKGIKAYFKLTAAFLGFTFVLGGGLIAIFSLTGLNYLQGNGYILSSVPIGIPLFAALILVILARKIALRLKNIKRVAVDCKIYSGERSVKLSGFFDSGNKVYHLGQPVSVIPLLSAIKIIDESRIKDEVKIHTVSGSKKIKIFTADKIEIFCEDKVNTVKHVKIGINPNSVGDAILHPDLMD